MAKTKDAYFNINKSTGKLTLNELGIQAVETLASYMCIDEEIARFLGVCADTLTNRTNKAMFTEAKINGQAKGKASLRRSQFKLAEKNASMAIFLGKNYLGQRDVVEQQTSFESTPEININIVDNSELEKALYDEK